MELTYTARRSGRLSAILRQDMGVSGGLMNRLKWQEKLLVNGVPRHTDFPVQPGDCVVAILDEPSPDYPAEDGALDILYEDPWLLAVDKPAGMLIHPSRTTVTGTLANRVMAYYEKTGQKSAFHPVSRLDRDTYGVVLLAKCGFIHTRMREASVSMQKIYHGLVYGCPETDAGVIDAPIARKPLPSLLREIRGDGKPSRTQYRVLERQGETALLELCPMTGRTHQLRLHCAYMGFPMVGDPQYGTAESWQYSQKQGVFTQRLCAKSVSFTHPITGKPLRITSHMDACKIPRSSL